MRIIYICYITLRATLLCECMIFGFVFYFISFLFRSFFLEYRCMGCAFYLIFSFITIVSMLLTSHSYTHDTCRYSLKTCLHTAFPKWPRNISFESFIVCSSKLKKHVDTWRCNTKLSEFTRTESKSVAIWIRWRRQWPLTHFQNGPLQTWFQPHNKNNTKSFSAGVCVSHQVNHKNLFLSLLWWINIIL